MYTIEEITSSWKYCVLSSMGGDPWALRTVNLAVIWISPPGQTHPVQVRGRIWTGSRAETGDRPCIHLDAEGTLIRSATSAITWEYSNVTGAVYVGPTVMRQVVSIRNNKTTDRYVPIFLMAGRDFDQMIRIPDHMKKGTSAKYDFWYRDIYIQYTFSNNVLSRVYHYWSKQRGYPETLTHVEEVIGTVDPKLGRWIRKSGTVTPLTALKGVDYPISATPRIQPSMKEWNRSLHRLMCGATYDRELFLGDLCRRCADDARFLDVNNIEYLRDLSTIAKDLKSMHQLLKGKVSLKSVADLYLSGKYGVQLTVKDTIHLAETSLREARTQGSLPQRVRAAETAWLDPGSCGTQIYCKSTYKITYQASDSKLLRFLNDWIDSGFFPTLRTGWELIPFSFVVDWFADVSEWLDQFDANTYWSTQKVIGATWSESFTIPGATPAVLPVGTADCCGTVTFSAYRRYTQRTLHVPRYFLDTPREFKNSVELAALIVQRGKKR